MAEVKMYKKKILLIGDAAVGKTSLVHRFVKSQFDPEYISTIGAVTTKKEIELEGCKAELLIYDLQGQILNSTINAKNYRGAAGAMVVFDATRKKTMPGMVRWIVDVYRVVKEKIPLVVLGNKIDLLRDFEVYSKIDLLKVEKDGKCGQRFDIWMKMMNHRIVDFFQQNYPQQYANLIFEPVNHSELVSYAEGLSEQVGKPVPAYFSSAKTGEHVEEAFKSLAELVCDR
jgi:small GTP-binding protein